MKVKLRAWQQEDRLPLATYANNKAIYDNVRDAFPHPYTLRHADEWIQMQSRNPTPETFVIEVDGQFAGGIGVVPQQDVFRCNIEIGYWLAEPYWGRGIATKAISLITKYIWKNYPHVVRIYAEVFEYNNASMKALERNGFELECIRKKAVIKNGKLLNDYVWVKFREGI